MSQPGPPGKEFACHLWAVLHRKQIKLSGDFQPPKPQEENSNCQEAEESGLQ